MIEMTKYLDILFHHVFGFAFILLVLPLGLSAGLIVLYPTAEAGASLWVNDPNYLGVAAAQTSDWNQYLTPAQNESDILGQMLQTETFQKQMTAQLDSNNVWQGTRERSGTLSSSTTNLKINLDGSHLLNLTFTCPRANLCVQVLQATIDVYKRALDQQQQQQAKAASTFYAAQLKQAHAGLATDQAALAVYLTNNPSLRGVDPNSAAAAALSLPAQFVQLARQVQSDQANIQSLQSKLDEATFNSSAASEVNNSAMKVVDAPVAFPGGILSSLPKKQLAIVWGACVGVGLGLLLLLGWLDQTAGEPADIEKKLGGVRVLAKIPLMKSGTRP
jgi:uncharacterized protein involved in exopolysaccharide biosynthesis